MGEKILYGGKKKETNGMTQKKMAGGGLERSERGHNHEAKKTNRSQIKKENVKSRMIGTN